MFTGQIVVSVLAVFLTEIEWRIRKNRVYHFVFQKGQNFHAIGGENRAVGGRVERLFRNFQEGRSIELLVRPFHECLVCGHLILIVIISSPREEVK